MKDNALWVCLLCWLPLGAAGLTVQFGNQAVKPEVLTEAHSDVLGFVDGSALHGKLERMDLAHGVTWASPEARNPIQFRPAHIDFIRFAQAQPVSIKPACHLWFSNGDDLYGSITSLDDQRVGFSTWFGGPMVIPRPAVRAITFLSANYSVVYEGPYDQGGWVVVNNSPKCWTFQDDAFVGTGVGTLGRELNLTNSTTVEFDVSWSGGFMLDVGIYCDATGRLEFSGGSCVVALAPRQVSLRQISQINNMGMGMPFNLGGAPAPEDESKSRMHVAIECDKAEGTVSVFVDHLLTKTWKDCSFQGGGTGILFRQQNIFSSATVKLSHLKISQWQGRCEPETSAPATNADAVYFINHDHAAGKIESIQGGQARLLLAGTLLDIPLERMTRIEFGASNAPPGETPGPWQVRAHFPGGGSLSFQLEKWDDKAVSGQSAIFGSLAFQPGAIRQMEFNLNRPKEAGVVADNKEFEELDE